MNKGITCKIWNIKADISGKSASDNLGDSISYILDELKTNAELGMENSIINDPLGQLKRECQYVQNDIKTVEGAYTGTHNLLSMDTNGAVAEMMSLKRFFSKEDGRTAVHGVISLSEEESGIENAAALMGICKGMLEEVFPNNQAIFGVHTNTENLHIHFIINTVGLDGKKIHEDDKFITNVLHPAINKYAKKYNLTPNEKWNKDYKESKQSYVQLKIDIRKAIDRAIEQSIDFESFVEILKSDGFSVNIGKYISVKSDDMGKAIRTHNLGPEYTKDSIVERIASRKEAFELIDIGNYVPNQKVRANLAQSKKGRLPKFSEMSEKEKKHAISLMKKGLNPWREYQKRSWQANRIVEEINTYNNVLQYMENYSKDGTLQGTLDGILEAKEKIAAEKKIIRQQKRKYKPILDIYEEMKEVEKKAYLYEHENRSEYRVEFEIFRNLTRRLRDGYNKDIYEVANFVNECEERLLYASTQLEELSEEYREVRNYGIKRGEILNQQDTILDAIEYYKSPSNRNPLFSNRSYLIVSVNNPSVLLKVEEQNILGKKSENNKTHYEITALDRYGEILEEYSTIDNAGKFVESVKAFERKYNFCSIRKVEDELQAEEFLKAVDKKLNNETIESNETEAELVLDIHRQPLSFTQALNHVPTKGNMFMIADSKYSRYVAMVLIEDKELTINIYDENHSFMEKQSIPVVKEKNKSGYDTIVNIKKKYGFSDKVITFDKVSDYKSYVTRGEQDNENKKRVSK